MCRLCSIRWWCNMYRYVWGMCTLGVLSWLYFRFRRLWSAIRWSVASKGGRIKSRTDEENSLLYQDQMDRLNSNNSKIVYALQTTISEKDAAISELDRTIQHQGEEIQGLRESLRQETAAKQQLLTRLSEVAAARLTDSNPAIVDLGDPLRPMKVGEMMGELYNDQWTSALSALETRHGARPEGDRDYARTLMTILRTAHEKCSEISQQRMADILQNYCSRTSELPRDIHKRIKDDRKKLAQLTLPEIKQAVLPVLETAIASPAQLQSAEVRAYAEECVHICWLMSVQDPPMTLADDVVQGSRYNSALYREYTCRGPYVAFPVWPALLIQEGGDTVSRGVVQCYKPRPETIDTQSIV